MANNFDETDIKILNLLQHNARLSNKEIAERMHKTVSPIYERIRRLEKDGFIKKYVAILDHKKIDRGLMAFTHVQLKDHSKTSLSKFESDIIQFEEVMECYHMSGNYDFILRVATKDLPGYHEFLMNKLFSNTSIVNVQSTFVMKEAKSETAYVIDEVKGGK